MNDEKESLIRARGFTIIATAPNLGSPLYIYAVNEKTGIGLKYTCHNDNFELSYEMIPNCLTYRISSGTCGPFKDEKHFNKYYEKLVQIVNALKWNGILHSLTTGVQ